MEVFIKRLLGLVFILNCVIPSIYAKANTTLKAASPNEVPFSLKPSAADFEFGKELVSFHSDLEKQKINRASLQKLTSHKSKDKTFSFISPTIARYEAFAKITNLDSFFKFCTIAPKPVNDFTNNLVDRLDATGDKYCRAEFISLLLKQKANTALTQREINFLKEASLFYVSGESSKEIITLLKHYQKNANLEVLSNALIDNYIESKIKPSSEVSSLIKSNNALNLFLKMNNHLDKKSANFFQDEFTKLNKSSQEALDNANFTLAKKRVTLSVEFYNKNKKFLDQKKVWHQLNITAKSFFNKARDKDAIDIFDIAKTIAPADQYSEAVFHTLWPHIMNQNYRDLKRVSDKNNLEKEFEKLDSKVIFWIAYALYNTGNKAKANEYFHHIINTTPYSFYSIVALKELAVQNKDLSEEQILSKLISNAPPVDYAMDTVSDQLKSTLIRFAIWEQLGNERFSTLEQRHIQSMEAREVFLDAKFAAEVKQNDFKEFITMNLIKLLHKQDKHLGSFKVFQDSLNVNSLSMNYKFIKYIFPLSYFSIIEKNSIDLDPILVISLIRQESAFNPNATSRVGAKGLMQLMPATAKRMNKKVNTNQLNNPEVNVALGTKYLRQLFTRFDGNLIYTLASYNAGENRIDRWKKEVFRNDDPLSTIEAIPFEETRNYVKLIYRNHFFYSLLNNKSVLTTPFFDSFKVSLNEKAEGKK